MTHMLEANFKFLTTRNIGHILSFMKVAHNSETSTSPDKKSKLAALVLTKTALFFL